MLARLAQLGQPGKSRAYIGSQGPPVQTEIGDILESSPSSQTISGDNDYRFSIGKLPVWAKKQIFERAGSLTPTSPPPASLQKGTSCFPLIDFLFVDIILENKCVF